MPNLTSQSTIARLNRLFAAYGLPGHIVTDNGTQLTSEELKNVMRQNGILNSTSVPGHPATNGLAERYVQTFKGGIKKLAHLTLDLEYKISLFLMQYRTTPNCTTIHKANRQRIFFLTDMCAPGWTSFIQTSLLLFAGSNTCKSSIMTKGERSFSKKDAVYLRSTTGKGNK